MINAGDVVTYSKSFDQADMPKLEEINMSEKERIARLLLQDQPYRDNKMYQEQLIEIEVEQCNVDNEVISIIECGNLTYTSILN